MIKTYLINLERDVDRMHHMSDQLKQLDIDFELIKAIEGKMLSDDFYADFCKKIQRLDWPRAGQLGCFLSHFKVWDQVANGDVDYALVLEDDIHLSSDTKRLLINSNWIPEDTDIVRLEVSTNKLLLENPQLIAIEEVKRTINKLISTSWCAGAYIISKSCAQKLVNTDPRLFKSVDAFIFSYEDSPLPASLVKYQITPALAIQDKYSSFTVPTSGGSKRRGFKSNIEDNYFENVVFQTKVFIKKINMNAIRKIIKGYTRVSFRD